MSLADRLRGAYDALRGHQAQPVRPPREGEIALSDPFRLFPNLTFDPYNPSILVSRKGMGVFDTMRRDDQIKAALSFKKLSVIASGWEITSPENRDEEWAPKRFVEHQLQHLEGTFGDALLQILTSLDYGYSVTEKVFATVPDGEWSGLIGLSSLKTRRPHEFDFDVDEHGNLRPNGVWQWTPDGRLKYPPPKFLLNVHRKEFGNFYGTSDLEAAYRGWWTKDNAYRWLAMYLERFGIPPIFAMYMGYTPAQQERLKAAIKNLQSATFGILPRESKDALELWSPGSETTQRVGDAFIPALDKFDKDMARAILMPGLIGMTPDDSTGSFSRARVHFDVFMLIVEHLRGETEELINEGLVRQMVALNFPVSEDEWPEFRFLPLTDAKTKELMDSWVALTGAEIVHSTAQDEAHIRDLLEFPELSEEEIAALEAEKKAEEEEERERQRAEAEAAAEDDSDEDPDDDDDAAGDDNDSDEDDDDDDDDDDARENAASFHLPGKHEQGSHASRGPKFTGPAEKLNESQESALIDYQLDATPFNEGYRSGRFSGRTTTGEITLRQAGHLNDAFTVGSRELSEPTIVHRGVRGRLPKSFTDQAFVSTTTDPAVAQRHVGRRGTVLRIELPRGMRVLRMKDHIVDEQAEILVPTGTRFTLGSDGVYRAS